MRFKIQLPDKLIPAARTIDPSSTGRAAGIVLSSRAATPPTPRADQSVLRTAGITSPSFGTGTREIDDSSKSSAAGDRAPRLERLTTAELYRQMGLQFGAPDAQTHCAREAGSSRVSPEPDAWWHPIRAAMSWVMELLIEGFAAYGTAMNPGLLEAAKADEVDRREPAEAPPSCHSSQHPYQSETSYLDEWLKKSTS